jgi:hypothetical protein
MTEEIKKITTLHSQRCGNGCEYSTKSVCLSNYGKPDADHLHKCELTGKIIFSDSVLNQVGCCSYVYNAEKVDYIPPKVEPTPEPKPESTPSIPVDIDQYVTKEEDKPVMLA